MTKSGFVQKRSKLVRCRLRRTRHRLARKGILLILYTLGLSLSFMLAYELRFDFAMDEDFWAEAIFICLGLSRLSCFCFTPMASLRGC